MIRLALAPAAAMANGDGDDHCAIVCGVNEALCHCHCGDIRCHRRFVVVTLSLLSVPIVNVKIPFAHAQSIAFRPPPHRIDRRSADGAVTAAPLPPFSLFPLPKSLLDF